MTDLLLQIEVARTDGQTVLSDGLSTTPLKEFRRIAAEAGVGTRAWLAAQGQVDLTYRAVVEVTRPAVALETLSAVPPRDLDAVDTSFLLPSRYVQSEVFDAVVTDEFPGLSGGALIAAARDWIAETFTYVAGASTAATTARDSYDERQGVCRDYAHVLIALARAAGIPARMASCYAPDVDPPDFHAVAQVRLEDGWHLVDATGMASPDQMAIIGVGRDAAEVSFLTTMGATTMLFQSVNVTR
ncbi:transglutaminase-like domain-containing protein [Jannaschia pohangensis]|nr:transglutaminase family protein [Jannaschia pohangensis]